MTQARVRAVYMRGGTSRCLVFHERDLPPAGVERDYILLAALGSPDPYGRQLDGLGGGISSLSKACIIGPTTHPGADVDYTFAQVEVGKAHVDYTGNCGNCSSAVGPFAIEERLIQPIEGQSLAASPPSTATSSCPAWRARARASRSTSSSPAARAPGASCRPARPASL